VGRVLETRVLRWIGSISYSLYLWQELFFPGRPHTLGRFQALPWSFLAAFGAATLSYYLVERPLIAWGKAQNAKRKTQNAKRKTQNAKRYREVTRSPFGMSVPTGARAV
jgi:peptidoglycan/LPS O-acetylase OafA/YrhL